MGERGIKRGRKKGRRTLSFFVTPGFSKKRRYKTFRYKTRLIGKGNQKPPFRYRYSADWPTDFKMQRLKENLWKIPLQYTKFYRRALNSRKVTVRPRFRKFILAGKLFKNKKVGRKVKLFGSKKTKKDSSKR